jgi:hypothetical protein
MTRATNVNASSAWLLTLMLLALGVVDAQGVDAAIGEADEEALDEELEADGSLDDATDTVDSVTSDRGLVVDVDARTSYVATENDNRDGNSASEDYVRARWRVQTVYNATERLRFGARVAGLCSTRECEPNFTIDSSIPTETGMREGDITIDSLFVHRHRNERFSFLAGRFQTKFVARGGVYAKSLDRNDSNNTRVNWTEGLQGTYRANNGWVAHGIAQYNSRSGPSNVRRDPLDFSDPDSRVSYYFGAENVEQQGALLQRGIGISYLPQSLLTDGTTNGRIDDYWGIVARVAARWPQRSDGPRLRVSSEVGFAPETQTRAAAQLPGAGEVDGWAWNMTASIMDFLPTHSIGLNYGRTDPGWLLSPQYTDNEELIEIRYQWRRDANFAVEFRARRRKDLEQRVNAVRKRDRYDIYLRLSWGYSTG